MSTLLPVGADSGDASLVVYGVHGRGQSTDFIADLARRVGGLDHLGWRIPAAPENTWYPQGFMRPRRDNEPALGSALATVKADLEELSQVTAPVVVLGFSQGACLLAEYLLTEQPAVSGAILHTGGFIGPRNRSFLIRQGATAFPVLLLTARHDPWVPLSRTRETARAFEELGCTVDLDIYEDAEHHINDQAVRRIRERLTLLSGTAGRPAAGESRQ
ncbi:alpha/beta hydrolase [Corynebacterium pacaense]|uniref:alpha/beta hydrolase n=1 Tax=Corynebacterium pacaense TaxID=1816684 RepID=UPI0009B94E44|nr:dienelactone hydrolase family protein [Corynebacterium pacaense]